MQRKRVATFTTTRTLRLAKLHGPGLAWFRTTAAGVSADFDPATNSGGYHITQRISAMVHADTNLDGIQYRSRFDTDQLCVALFDRADTAVQGTTEGAPIDKAWVKALLKTRGYRLIEF